MNSSNDRQYRVTEHGDCIGFRIAGDDARAGSFGDRLTEGQSVVLGDGTPGMIVDVGDRIHTGNPGDGTANYVFVKIGLCSIGGKCLHRRTRHVGPDVGYRDIVCPDENPMAHGGYSTTELCDDCGATRAVNCNQGHAEYGHWH